MPPREQSARSSFVPRGGDGHERRGSGSGSLARRTVASWCRPQLGRNQRLAATGSLVATAIMGLIGYLLSYQAMFVISAALALPLLIALAAIRGADIDFARSCGAPYPDASTRSERTTHRSLWKSPGLLIFGAYLFLFQLANACMVPFVGAALVYEGESASSLVVAAMIILPQVLTALMSPWVGRVAQTWGRRPRSADPWASVCLDRRTATSH